MLDVSACKKHMQQDNNLDETQCYFDDDIYTLLALMCFNKDGLESSETTDHVQSKCL